MLQIKKITVENFRGIKLPVTLDFYKGTTPTSVVIYGRNGTGKSTLIDAWEWLINFTIKDLDKEGVSTKDYPHKSSDGVNSYIHVEFNHPTIKTASAKFNKTKITSPTTSGEYNDFKPHTVYPNYLRYSDLQEFVFLTKTKKYEYIAKFFGLEKFTKNQSDLQASLTRLMAQLANLKGELGKHELKVAAITGKSTVDEVTVVAYINSIADKHKIARITDFKYAMTVKVALDNIVKANPIALENTEWTAFHARLIQFYAFPVVKKECEELENLFAELKKDEANISQLFLTALYDLGIETIEKMEDKTTCPLCDSVFPGDLIHHIQEKHKLLAELNAKKQNFDTKKAALERKFDAASRKIHAIQSETSVSVLATFKTFFDAIRDIAIDLPAIITTVKTPLKDLLALDLTSQKIIDAIDAVSVGEAVDRKVVIDRLAALVGDENTKTLASDFTNLVNLITAYSDHVKADAKLGYLASICANVEALFNHLTTYIQNQIQATFTNIQADVIECYNILESSNAFLKNPAIKLVTGKDKAVELEIEFVTEKITPAYKFMSESQVNSFGLAIFLSAVKHFNREFKFIILDDVVNSFDAFKRPRVAQLIATKFSDFQFLILTHDQIFFDTVQKAFPNWQRYKFVSWDFATGPSFRISKDYSEDIQHLIDEDEAVKAGQTLGRYLEWSLGNVNESMQTPIRYKVENAYTLGEFYDPLVSRFRDKLKQAGKTHKLVQAFNDIEQGTIFRNYCAHWKNEANGFTSPEIDTIFKKWMDIEKMVYCYDCKTNVKLERNGSAEYVKCSCGTLDLRADAYYL